MNTHLLHEKMIPFQDSSNMIISGCSGSGKTVFLKNLLRYKDDLFITLPTKIILIYKHWQNEYTQIDNDHKDVDFLNVLPTESELEEAVHNHAHSIIICDDMLDEIMDNEFICNLFTRLSHHFRITTILLLQNFSANGKFRSTLCKNAHVNIMMKSARDNFSLRSLGQQLGEYQLIKNAYKDATLYPFGYLVCDTHPNADVKLRYRTCIFPFNYGVVVYMQ